MRKNANFYYLVIISVQATTKNKNSIFVFCTNGKFKNT